jgi:site-specific DNA recombinase
MTHTYTSKGQRRYRYYVCNNAQQHGWAACPTPSIPAGEIEEFVVGEIRAIGRDPALVAATLAESRRLASEGIKRLKAERAALERQRRVDEAEQGQLAATGGENGHLVRLVCVQERISDADRRLCEVEDELAQIVAFEITEEHVAAAVGEFDAVWGSLAPKEQARILALMIDQIDHDGKTGNVAITFRPTGLKSLTVAKPELEESAA